MSGLGQNEVTYALDVGIVVVCLVTLVVIWRLIGRWATARKRAIASAVTGALRNTIAAETEFTDAWDAYVQRLDAGVPIKVGEPDYLQSPVDRAMNEFHARSVQLRRESRRATFFIWFVRFLNLLATLLVLVPLGLAMENLILSRPQEALQFDLAGIATLIVTKGLVFIFTWVVVPILQTIPVAGAGWAFRRVRDRKKAEAKK